jgi:hypothetical protein
MRMSNGSKHDFKLFKETYNSLGISKDIVIIGDSGYQGIERIHSNSLIPCKRPHECDNFNKTISQLRIPIEHVIRELKKFEIIGGKNRDRRKRFGLRVRLMSGIYNWGR